MVKQKFIQTVIVLAVMLGGHAQAQESIKIGSLFPDSGPFAPMIRYVQDPSALAVEVLNAQGGALGRKYELVQMAHNGTPASVTAAVTRLAQQAGVNVVIGFSSSASSLALIPRLAALNVLMMDISSNSSQLIGKACGRNYFHLTTTDDMAVAALQPIVQQSGARTWNLLLPDYALGHNFSKAFANVITQHGATVQTQLFAPMTTTDFGSQITQLREKPADGLAVLWPIQAGSIALAKQAQQFGLFDKYKSVIASQFVNPMIMDAQGDATVGIYAPQSYWWEMPGNHNAAFVKAFEQRFNRKPTFFDADVYQAFEVLHAAIVKAGSTELAAVRTALSSIRAQTIMGDVQMRAADHQLLRPMAMTRVFDTGSGQAELRLQAVLDAAMVVPPANPECKL